jgi:Protein of unknown function with PCYCGC motif
MSANTKSGNWLIPALVAVFVLGMIGWINWENSHPSPEPAGQAAQSDDATPAATSAIMNAPEPGAETIPSYFASAEAARPYPATLPPSQFPNPVIAHAYAVAQQIPGTLAQQPCYCMCYKTAGHRGLLDCYASLHASACSVCIQEALLTEKLQKEGRTPSQIREAIIRGDWRSVELGAEIE